VKPLAIVTHMARQDSPRSADARILPQGTAQPGRSGIPAGVLKTCRLIYRVVGQQVAIYLHLMDDGRRDMQSLLARRLLGGH